jgi:hypothetical protein
VDARSGGYEATVARIQQVNARMTRDAVAGAQQTAGAVKAWETSLTGVGSAVRTLASGFVALQAINFVKNFSAFAEQLNEVHKRTGVLVEDLHALERIGKLEGATFEEITTGMRFLNKAIAEANNPLSEQAKLFKVLGVDAQGIVKSGGNVKDVMLALSNVFKENLTVADRYLVAQKLLGRSSEGLINVLSQGRPQLVAWIDEQKRLGVITTETANKADEARDKFEIFKGVLQARVGGPMIDFLTDMIARLQEAGPWIVWFSERVQKGAEILDGWRASLERAGDATRNWATGASQSVAELSRQLEHLQRFAPGDIASQNRLRGIIDQKTQGALIDLEGGSGFDGALSTTFTATQPRKINVAGALAGSDAAKKAEDLANKTREAAARLQKELLQLNIASAELAKSQGNLTVDVRGLNVQLINQERAAAIAAAAHDKTLTPAVRAGIDAVADGKIAQFDAKAADELRKEGLENLKREIDLATQAEEDFAAVTAASARDRQIIEQRAVDAIENERQLRDIQADRLGIIGQTAQADKARLVSQIQYLEKIRELENNRNDTAAVALRDEQIRNAQTQLNQLGEVSINVGQTIANSVGDAFEGVILGVSKLSDVGKNLFNAIIRDVAQFFTNVMVKKLGFENLIFTNLRGFGGQAQTALAGGMSGGGIGDSFLGNLFGGGGGQGGGGSGFGGFLSNIFGSFGRPSGVSGPLMENGSFLSSGAGSSGFGGFLGQAGSGISSLFGTSGGGTGLGSIGTFFSDIGSGNSALGSFGGPILGGAAALITAGFTGGFKKSKIGSTVGSTVGGAIGSIWGPIGTFIGATIGNMIGSLFNQEPNPTAIMRAKFSGIFFDAIDSAFRPGTVSVGTLKATDIGKGRTEGIRAEVQKVLEGQSQQWTDILNAFSPAGQAGIIPTLEGTNSNLNNAFARLKFSEKGKRSIDEELADFAKTESPKGFFHAIRASIGAGFQAELSAAGLTTSAELARDQFQRGALLRGDKATGGVFNFPTDEEGARKFIDAIGTVARSAASLNQFSPGGITPFVTAKDVAFLEHGFGSVFGGGSDPKEFVKNAESLKEKIAPVTDFLKNAVTEATTLLANGLTTAFESASKSDAITHFQEVIGQGTKDILTKGITESILSSGQFNEFLAPIQQTIRDFSQQAIDAGAPPDIQSMREKLSGQLQGLVGRVQNFAPLLGELQKTGEEIDKVLGISREDIAAKEAAERAVENAAREEQARQEEAARRAAELASQSASLFGNGLIGALQSATQSDAKRAFMQTLGEGTRDVVFKGITDAFIASAQFNDLLKPIQDTISRVTQQAVETGQAPDLGALLGELSPQILALKTRGEFLGPLLAEIQKLGLNLNDLFASFVGKQAPRGPTNIKIDINGFNKDVKELANELDDHLRGLLGAN